MFDPQSDPLGLGLQSRARAKRWQDVVNGVSTPMGPLPDPQWDAFFQAVGESNPGKQMRFSADTSPAPISPGADLGTAFAQNSKQLKGFDPFTQIGQLSTNKRKVKK